MLTIQKHKCATLYSLIFCALAVACFVVAPAQASIEADRLGAVIFSYQRVGDDTTPQGNISLELFQEHIRELKTGGYTVLSLIDIVAALKSGETLPQKTIGITFDGADLSTLEKTVPILESEKLPFTVFFASDMPDSATPSHMNWEQLKKLRKNGLAHIGILPAAYAPLTDMDPKQVLALINRAIARYREEFGAAPDFFAYPYGETSSDVRKIISEYSFAAGFGQQSGVAHGGSDFLILPRFTMTDSYGDPERFRLTAGALPLPVSEIVPEDMLIRENPPSVGFTITPEITDISKLSCFISGVGKADLAHLGDNRVEIRMAQPLVDRRTRVNCTIPDDTIIPGQAQSWRWFGMLITIADAGEAAPPSSDPPSEDAALESE